jgi:hypothetical protein
MPFGLPSCFCIETHFCGELPPPAMTDMLIGLWMEKVEAALFRDSKEPSAALVQFPQPSRAPSLSRKG